MLRFLMFVVTVLILLNGCRPGMPGFSEVESLRPVHQEHGEAVVQENRSRAETAFRKPAPAAVDPPAVAYLPVSEPFSESLPEPLETFLTERPLLPYAGDFPLCDHTLVERFLDQYQGRQKQTITAWLERSGRYIPKMQLIFAAEGVPLDLAYLAMIESGFNVRAYSWAHAAGPWQFIESTGAMFGLKNDWWQDERLDLELSTRAAAHYLKDLYARFEGDWYLAIAAYNAGPGRVQQAIRAKGSRDFWELAEGKILKTETVEYVPKLIAALHLISEPHRYGFTELNPADPFDYDIVTVATQTDLEIIAELAGVSYQEIKNLNPALKRWSTPPGVENYRVRVPVGTAETFSTGYSELPADQRARYHRHQIKPGDTLLQLAKRYDVRVEDIMTLNQINNPQALRVGSNLILPLREGFTQRPVEALADSYVRSRRQSYRVQSGDSLWSIARRFEVTEKQLRVWNNLGWSNLLRPGQELLVSEPTRRVAAAAPAPAPTSRIVYQVEVGDTLWAIGRRFSVDAEAIRRWNDLTSEHILQPGQRLTLLVPTGRQS